MKNITRKITNKLHSVEAKLNNHLYGEKTDVKKDAGINGVVVEAGILIVAVVLLVVFSKTMTPIIQNMLNGMNAKIQSILSSQTL